MIKLNDYKCPNCLTTKEVLTGDKNVLCQDCGEVMEIVPNFAGYQIKGNNSASTRPKGAGYRKGKK